MVLTTMRFIVKYKCIVYAQDGTIGLLLFFFFLVEEVVQEDGLQAALHQVRS